jgi:peptide methionine sulfoxide reductase MsrA
MAGERAQVVAESSTRAVQSQNVKRFYLAPDDHTDYLWTLDEKGYRNAGRQHQACKH